MSKVVRSVKNVTKGYSAVEVKVRNATSNDAWGPTSTDMSEIAQMTYNSSGDFYDIMNMLDKRLNDKGKNWRHVLKSLKVLDYCLHEGSELVVTWARKNIYVVRTLREFQYIDEDGRDVGNSVRVSAKELTSLIMDEDRLRAERHDRKLWKSRVTGLEDFGPPPGVPNDSTRNRRNDRRNKNTEEEDLEYKLAIEASKNEAEEDAKRRASKAAPVPDDDDLARAIKLSREEEDLRRRELEETNANALFDDTPAQPSQVQPTGYNQGYQQQGAVDWFGNSLDQQQPQNTGYLNNVYSQPTGFQGQQTGFQNGYGYGQYQQPQQSVFDQSQFQQPQQNFMQPQQTAFNMNNPYSQQNSLFQDQNQQQQQQPQSAVQPGSNNPWASSGGSMDDIKPQQTGSNNPFASSINRPQTAQPQRSNTLSALQEERTQNQFNQSQFSQPVPPMPFQPAQQQAQQQQAKPQDPYRANLNALLSSGDGQDTFGNTGEMRIPAQHTAPGTFINSAGSGANRIQANQTGNPFMPNQFTGLPQQNRMMPAQTGPVGGFGGGFGSANPFGSQQRQGQQPQSGSLIDL